MINAGDGQHEHPTQALLDALSIRHAFGKVDGLTVAICGDVMHSRVARSNVLLLTMLGAQVRLVGPPTLMPTGADRWGVERASRHAQGHRRRGRGDDAAPAAGADAGRAGPVHAGVFPLLWPGPREAGRGRAGRPR